MVRYEEITIIIPAFNEEVVVGKVVQELISTFPGVEIAVVNDGSRDQTSVKAREAGAIVIDHEKNLGYGASLRTGVLFSKRPYVLFCDADGQHSSENVKSIIEAFHDCDIVIGKRDKNSNMPVERILGKLFLKKFANFLAGQEIPDFNSGLRIVKKDVLLKYLHLMPDGFSFSTTTTFAFLKGKHRMKWIPVTVSKRLGKSSVQQWKHGPEALMLMLRLTILFEPLKVFLFISGILLLLSIIGLAQNIFFGGTPGITDSTVLLCISTLFVFLFGLICDQISALRRELHERN